jgi:hypothetical protein
LLVLEIGILISILVSSAAWVGYLWRSDANRTRRVLRKARVTRVCDLVDGQLVCIVGRVEPIGEPLVSMITRIPCVAFDTTIQFFAGNNFTVPERVDVTRQLVPFDVVDATGRVRIDAPQAALCNKPWSRNERHEERLIPPGAKIRIVGSARVEPAASTTGEHHYREAGAVTATLTGTSKYPLLIDLED